MQRIKQKSKSNEFSVGDKVRINNMFFRNHGMKIQDIEGTVKYVVPSWDIPQPSVKIVIDFNPSFFQMVNNGYVKMEVRKEDGKIAMMITIKTIYLEKIK